MANRTSGFLWGILNHIDCRVLFCALFRRLGNGTLTLMLWKSQQTSFGSRRRQSVHVNSSVHANGFQLRSNKLHKLRGIYMSLYFHQTGFMFLTRHLPISYLGYNISDDELKRYYHHTWIKTILPPIQLIYDWKHAYLPPSLCNPLGTCHREWPFCDFIVIERSDGWRCTRSLGQAREPKQMCI